MCLYTYTGVKHDFHIRRCSCRLIVSFILLADLCDRPFYNLQFVLCVSDIYAHITPRGLLFLNFRDSRSDTFDTTLFVEQD